MVELLPLIVASLRPGQLRDWAWGLLWHGLTIGACLGSGAVGSWIARRRGIDWEVGQLIGFVLGPLGWLMLVLLPGHDPPR